MPQGHVASVVTYLESKLVDRDYVMGSDVMAGDAQVGGTVLMAAAHAAATAAVVWVALRYAARGASGAAGAVTALLVAVYALGTLRQRRFLDRLRVASR